MTDPTFRLVVEDVFVIRGRGTVVTGVIQSGSVREGDEVVLCNAAGRTQLRVDGVESAARRLKQAEVGQNVGLLFRQVSKDELQRGDELTGM